MLPYKDHSWLLTIVNTTAIYGKHNSVIGNVGTHCIQLESENKNLVYTICSFQPCYFYCLEPRCSPACRNVSFINGYWWLHLLLMLTTSRGPFNTDWTHWYSTASVQVLGELHRKVRLWLLQAGCSNHVTCIFCWCSDVSYILTIRLSFYIRNIHVIFTKIYLLTVMAWQMTAFSNLKKTFHFTFFYLEPHSPSNNGCNYFQHPSGQVNFTSP